MNSREFYDLTALVMMLENKMRNADSEAEYNTVKTNREYFWKKLWDEINRVNEILIRKENNGTKRLSK